MKTDPDVGGRLEGVRLVLVSVFAVITVVFAAVVIWAIVRLTLTYT